MDGQQKLTAPVSVLLALTLMLSCTPWRHPAPPVSVPSISQVSGESVSLPGNDIYEGVYDPALAAQGANSFAFELAAILAEKAGDDSFVCSPISVWFPLAALFNATAAEHRADLAKALGAEGLSKESFNEAASSIMAALTNAEVPESDRYNPLQIANAIFISNLCTVSPTFANTFEEYYQGNAMSVDFTSQETVDLINKWASDHTEGLIDNLIESVEVFSRDTVAAIANAIYYSDRWISEFDENQTKPGAFHSPSGDVDAMFMSKQGDGMPYYEDSSLQAIDLKLSAGGGMYILLPKDGNATKLLSEMSQSRLDEIAGAMQASSGKLLLPRFQIEGAAIELNETLESLGIPLFDASKEPISGYELIGESTPLFISKALQKAMIKVDEKGTTAAAVTIMAISRTSAPMPTDPFEMVCDKPFAFVLYGPAAGISSQALFIGAVKAPN